MVQWLKVSGPRTRLWGKNSWRRMRSAFAAADDQEERGKQQIEDSIRLWSTVS